MWRLYTTCLVLTPCILATLTINSPALTMSSTTVCLPVDSLRVPRAYSAGTYSQRVCILVRLLFHVSTNAYCKRHRQALSCYIIRRFTKLLSSSTCGGDKLAPHTPSIGWHAWSLYCTYHISWYGSHCCVHYVHTARAVNCMWCTPYLVYNTLQSLWLWLLTLSLLLS